MKIFENLIEIFDSNCILFSELQTSNDKTEKELIAARERETKFLDHIKTLETNDEETNKDLQAANDQISALNSSLSLCMEKVANFSAQKITFRQCEEQVGQLKSHIETVQKYSTQYFNLCREGLESKPDHNGSLGR